MIRLVLFSLLLLAPVAHAQETFRGLYSTDGRVRSASLAGDTLYLGGDFGLVAAPTGPLALLDKTTGRPDLSQPRVGDLSFGEALQVVLPDGAGGYYVAGPFGSIGGEPRRNLAHVLADGTVDPDFAPNPQVPGFSPYYGTVNALVLHEGVLYVGGRFDEVGGQPRRNLAALDPETGVVLPLSVTMSYPLGSSGLRNGEVGTLAVQDGVLYFSGLFFEVGGLPRRNAAAVRTATGEVLSWDLAAESDSGPSFIGIGALVFGDSTLYVGGDFDRIRGQARRNGAEVSLADPVTGAGGVPTAWITELGMGINSVVTSDFIYTAVYSPTHLIYRISRQTGNAVPVTPSGPFALASAITFDPTGGPAGQGMFYVAADFRSPLAPRGRFSAIVGVDAVTLQRTGFRVIAGAGALGGDYIRTLAVEPGSKGRLFAGGYVRQYDGAVRRFLSGIDLTTGRPTALAEGYEIFSSVEETATSPDGRYLYFVTFNGIGVADLATGDIQTFPAGGTRFDGRPALVDTTGDAARGIVHRGERGGPVAQRADGSPAPAFRPPVASAARRGGTSSVRGGSSALAVVDDRLCLNDFGSGVVCFDRATGAVVWATAFQGFDNGPNSAKLLHIEAGPPGVAGDTLFASGPIYRAAGEPRGRFVALDAATGAVLDWNVGPVEPSTSNVGIGMAALPDDGRLWLGGFGISDVAGQPRRDLFAVDRASAALLPWNPNTSDRFLGAGALTAQARTDGGAPVVYAADAFYATGQVAAALDGASGAPLAWNPGIGGAGASGLVNTILLAESTGWVVMAGEFAESGEGGHANVVAVRPAAPFAVAEEPGAGGVPAVAALRVAGPNPLRSRTVLSLSLPVAGPVAVALYDVLGRRVAVLHDGPLPAGTSQIPVDATPLPAGVYAARAVGDAFAASVTLTVVR